MENRKALIASIFLFCIGFLLLSAVILFAETNKSEGKWQISNDGEYRLFVDDGKKWTDVTAEEKLAREHPRMEVPINFQTILERTDFFHLTKKQRSNEAIVYNASENKRELREEVTEKDERKYVAIYVILVLILMLFMAISHTLFLLKSKYFITAIGITNLAVVIVAFITLIITSFTVGTAVVFIVTIFTAVGIFSVIDFSANNDNLIKNRKAYKILMPVFFVAMAVSLFC